ncbi:hypothetical protein [Lignipirellula cremea]|uniref:hypothetical protein n=1 Tax=Lignipirellula cremea TaxID=2528010 RepID=UPI00119D671F
MTGPEASAACGDLYSAYRQFCEEAGRKAKCSSEFGKQAKALDGVRKTRPSRQGSRTWVYEGIGLARGVAAQNARRRSREEVASG